MATADMNQNGYQDILVRSRSNGFAIFSNDGSGGFDDITIYETGPGNQMKGLYAGDLNGNGYPDVALPTGNNDRFISVWLNNGDGTLGTRADYPIADSSGALIRGFVSGDVNGNGYNDIVALDSRGLVTVFMNDTNGVFSVSQVIQPVSASTLAFTMAIGDLGNTGSNDVVIVARLNNDNNQYRLVRYLNDGTGTLTPSPTLTNLPNTGSGVDMALADLDNDGNLDVVITNGNIVRVLKGTAAGGFSTPAADYPLGAASAHQLAIADINGNGALDLAIGTSSQGSTTAVLLNDGNAEFSLFANYGNDGSGGTGKASLGVALVDIDGNSTPDLLSTSSIIIGAFTETFLNTRLNLTDPFAPGEFDLVSVPNNSAGLPLPEVLQSWPGGGGAAPLSWSRAEGFVNTYTLKIGLDPAMSMVVLEQSGLTATSFNLPTGLLQNSTRYYWQVEAENIAGTTLSSSGPWSFSTQCLGDIADDFGLTAANGGGPDGMIDFGDFAALLGLIGPCP